MTRISKPMRGRRGNARLDLTDIKHALRDQRVWTALGLVLDPGDGSPHWEIVGDSADVMVEVQLMPDQVTVTCRLAAGMWIVPDVGDEVAVLLPAGELDFMPIITCILAGSVPKEQGPQPQRMLLVRGEVVIHDGSGGAMPLPKLSELQHVVDDFYNHSHASFGGPAVPIAGPPIVKPSIVGTEVLKAK